MLWILEFGKVGSYSVQGMNFLFQCLILHPYHYITNKTLQHFFMLVMKFDQGVTSLVSILLEPKIHYQKENPFIIYSWLYMVIFFLHYTLGPESTRKWEMFVTLQHAMTTPITTPNSRHLINKMSFEGCLVEGDACILGFRTWADVESGTEIEWSCLALNSSQLSHVRTLW